MKNLDKYEDIIDLPHFEPRKHPRMSEYSRAAQFAPFAALVGYDDAIDEAGRYTDADIELDDNSRDILDQKLRMAVENKKLCVSITYFVPDELKSGGSCETVFGKIKKLDSVERKLFMTDGGCIAIDMIRDIELTEDKC